MCLRGASGVESELLARVSDPRLRVYVVWVPKYGGREGDVPAATGTVPDRRAVHYWDGKKALVRGYRATLDLPVDAWDIYFLYGPEAHWDGAAPPPPRFWMHQLRGASGPAFDPEEFAARARALLVSAGARIAASAKQSGATLPLPMLASR